MYDWDNNLSYAWTERGGVELMLLDEQPYGEFQTEITETRDSKFVEGSFSIGQQVFFPFLIAGSGTVAAGIVLDVVTEVTISFSCLTTL